MNLQLPNKIRLARKINFIYIQDLWRQCRPIHVNEINNRKAPFIHCLPYMAYLGDTGQISWLELVNIQPQLILTLSNLDTNSGVHQIYSFVWIVVSDIPPTKFTAKYYKFVYKVLLKANKFPERKYHPFLVLFPYIVLHTYIFI